MSKILRATQKIFGLNAGLNEIGQFGSLAAGTPAYATTPAQVQALANYLAGWFGAVLGSNSPAIEDMNAVHFLFAYQLAYLMQAGVAEYDASTTYYIGSVVNSAGVLYASKTDTNIGNALSSTPNWKVLGTITDMASPASASYDSVNSKFVWQSAANKPAYLDAASILLRNFITSSNALTLAPPSSIAADYSIVLPSLPAAISAMVIDTSGNITASGSNITGPMIETNISIPGTSVQTDSKNVVVSNTNSSKGLAIVRFICSGVSGGPAGLTSGEGASVVGGTPGAYTVTFDSPFDDVPSVNVTVVNTLTRSVTLDSVSSVGCIIYIWSGASLSAQSFHFTAIGRRVN